MPCQSRETHKRLRSKNLLRENTTAVIPPHTLHVNRHIWDLRDLLYTQEQCYCTLTSTWTCANISITLPLNESCNELWIRKNSVMIVKPKCSFRSNTVTFYVWCLHVLMCLLYYKHYSTNQNTAKLNATQLQQSVMMRTDIDYWSIKQIHANNTN